MSNSKVKPDYGGYLSESELYFSWWCDDLKNRGIINRYFYESNTFTLSTAKKYPFLKKMVTKSKIESLHLMDEHVYTPDFLVEWNPEYDGIFFREIINQKYSTKPPFFAVRSRKDGKLYTFFEVKPDYDQNNMTRLFRITQKWLYDKHELYVDLATVPGLFKKTFVPERYLFTNKSKVPRKIDFGIRLIGDYVALLKRNNFKQVVINESRTINF